MSLPRSWAEAIERLGRLLASEEEAAEWARIAVSTLWGRSLEELDRSRRALALQKLSGVVLALEDLPYDVAFDLDLRKTVGEIFRKYFAGIYQGPEWRLGPGEDDRPPFGEMTSDFGSDAAQDAAERLLALLKGNRRAAAARAEKGVQRLPADGIGPDTNPAPSVEGPGIAEENGV